MLEVEGLPQVDSKQASWTNRIVSTALVRADEEWCPVVGHEGRYDVSSLGRIRSVTRRVRNGGGTRRINGETIRSNKINSGYLMCSLSANGRATHRLVHRVVADAFLGSCPRGYEVNHKNGVKTDNRVANLEYMTRRDNMAHAKSIGLLNNDGEHNPSAKLTVRQVGEIRSRYRFGGGPGYKALAAEYGVTWEAIRALVKGLTWTSAS